MNKYLRFIIDSAYRFKVLDDRGFFNNWSDEQYLKEAYRAKFHKQLDLDNPQTFSEKLQWLKLYNRKPEHTQMVDKAEAKKYVANLIGEEYIIPTLGIYNSVEEINFDKLPNQFVLKCTHDSGGVVICKNKNKLDITTTKNSLHNSLKRNYYSRNREYPYKNVKPRIIAEQYMVDESGYELKDYKFFCFNGEPKLCQVIAGRDNIMTVDFYDNKWIHQPFHEPKDYPFSEKRHNRPSCLDEMWNLSTILSQGHPFLRVDFYEINNKIKFGELTFFPTSGMGGFEPEEWDYKFGEWIKLPDTKIIND